MYLLQSSEFSEPKNLSTFPGSTESNDMSHRRKLKFQHKKNTKSTLTFFKIDKYSYAKKAALQKTYPSIQINEIPHFRRILHSQNLCYLIKQVTRIQFIDKFLVSAIVSLLRLPALILEHFESCVLQSQTDLRIFKPKYAYSHLYSLHLVYFFAYLISYMLTFSQQTWSYI